MLFRAIIMIDLFYFILFYFILLYFTLFYFILFYFILFYFILFTYPINPSLHFTSLHFAIHIYNSLPFTFYFLSPSLPLSGFHFPNPPTTTTIIIIIIIIIYLTANGLSPGGSGYNACA
jgi:hypothetical protein